jgi:hypothetical protein
MSDVSNATAVNVAPAHPAGQGKSQPGGHVRAWRAQPAFAPEAKLNVIGGNLWRPDTPSHRFYNEVLTKAPATVQECIDKAGALAEPFTAKAVQNMLRWMYTANGAFLEVDGERFAAPAPVATVKPAPAKKSVAKAKVEKSVAVKAAAKNVAVKKSKIV